MRHRLLAIGLVLCLAALACGGEAGTQISSTATSAPITNDSPTEASSPTTAPTEAPTAVPATEVPAAVETFLGDAVTGAGVVVTVLQVEDPATPGLFYEPEAGQRLVALEVVVGNAGAGEQSVNPLSATLLDSDGFTYTPELAARSGQLPSLDLSPGEQVQGWIAFEIPEAATVAELKFATALFGGEDIRVSTNPAPEGHTPLVVPLTRDLSNVPGVGGVAELSGYSFSAVTLEDPGAPGVLYQPQAGYRLVAVEVVVGNINAENFTPNVLEIYLVDENGFVYQAELGARDGQLDLVELAAGEKAKGWVAYVIPEAAQPAYVKFAPVLKEVVLSVGVK